MPGFLATAGVRRVVRSRLFWGVCVWARVGVAVLVLLALLRWTHATLIGVAAVVGVVVIVNASRSNSVWWHRSDHIVVGSVVVTTAVVAIAVGDVTVAPWVILGCLLADVVLGMRSALYYLE